MWPALVGLLTVLSGAPSAARAERFDTLALGPELRLRERARADQLPRYELALPHGLRAPHGELVARFGVVLPTRGEALAFPLTVGMRYTPFDWRVRPLLGVDVGGYFVVDRATRPASDESDVAGTQRSEWSWSTRALAGVQIQLASFAALRLYADAQWTEIPEDARHRDDVASGFGAGCELSVALPPPRLALLDTLLDGTHAPGGW